MRILVVEDDAGIARGLRTNLKQRGYVVDVCDSVQHAWTSVSVERFDLILLDLGLSDGDGSELLQRIRQCTPSQSAHINTDTPVLIITAREGVSDRISGLNRGADDDLVKPFDFDELEARMRALLRRAAGRSQPTVTRGNIVIDPANHSVLLDGTPVELSRREFTLLLLLLNAKGRILSRQQLESRLYNWDGLVESNAVEVHVHHLRRKLGDGLILNMRGVGYYIAQPEAERQSLPT